MFKLDLENAEKGIRDQIANTHWIIEKAHEFQKNIYFCFVDYTKAFDCCIPTNCWKFLKRQEYQTTFPASWEICMQEKKAAVKKKQQLELGMEQQIGSKSGQKYLKAVYYHHAYLTYIQSTSWEMLGWKKQKL